MTDPDRSPTPDPTDATAPVPPPPTPPGTSKPSGSSYTSDLPLPEDLQAMLPQGEYVIESFLGQGGMGAVYRGLQMPLRRPVAIKILGKSQAGEEDDFAFEERFKREAYAMATLTHPHIVQVYDCGDAGEHFLFISMELVEGGDLSEAIKSGACTPDAALKLIPQICAGMHAAHERGLVHRDIKPANIFLTKDGRAKVADFGLAKRFDVQSTFVTKVGMGMGTPDYAAPEQYDGVPDLDHRADVYALGVMMYQMLTGRLPRGANYKTPSQMVGVDARIDAVVARAMANERDERYQSAADVATDLAAIAGPAPRTAVTRTRPVPAKTGPGPHAGSPGARTPTPAARSEAASIPGRASAPPKKKSGAAGIIAFVVTLAVLAGGTWMMQKRKLAPSDGDNPAKPAAGPAITATKDAPFINSLGMKFVPVPGTDVLFCIHETRWRDYAAYAGAAANMSEQRKAFFLGTAKTWPDSPVASVSWDDAQAFCAWLSRQEGRTYRLPTDREWSFAVGIGDQEKWNADTMPSTVNKVPDQFPWGNAWPPPKGAGNYRDETFHAKHPAKPGEKEDPWLQGYDDGFEAPAPVMSLAPNRLGIYDLGGNVWEWVADWHDASQQMRTLRGAGNASGPRNNRNDLLSSNRIALNPAGSNSGWGFRVALVNPSIPPAATASTPVAPATTPPGSLAFGAHYGRWIVSEMKAKRLDK